MTSFGENLRQARTARNITLQEIAASTKISTRALQALEDEHFEQLPGGIFNKGFVRAYARYVGIDEEKALAEYLVAAKVPPSGIDMEVLSTQVAAAAGARQPWSPNAATVAGVLAVLVALGMGGLWLNEQRKEMAARRSAESAVSNPPAQTTVVTTPEPNPSLQSAAGGGELNATQNATQGATQNATQDASNDANQASAANAVAASSANQATASQPPAAPVAPVSKTPTTPASAVSRTGAAQSKATAPVEVSISATTRVWVSVQSDGKTVETLTLDPEKPETRSRSYTAKEKLLLVVGNPAGLSVTYNGKPAGVLGLSGQRATITFTPRGIEKQ